MVDIFGKIYLSEKLKSNNKLTELNKMFSRAHDIYQEREEERRRKGYYHNVPVHERFKINPDNFLPISDDERARIKFRIPVDQVDQANVVNCWGPWNRSPEFSKLSKYWGEMKGNLKTLDLKRFTRALMTIGFEKENGNTGIRDKVFREQVEAMDLYLTDEQQAPVPLDAPEVPNDLYAAWNSKPSQRMDGELLAQFAINEKKILREILLRYNIVSIQTTQEAHEVQEENIGRLQAFGWWAFPGIEMQRNLYEIAEVDLLSFATSALEARIISELMAFMNQRVGDRIGAETCLLNNLRGLEVLPPADDKEIPMAYLVYLLSKSFGEIRAGWRYEGLNTLERDAPPERWNPVFWRSPDTIEKQQEQTAMIQNEQQPWIRGARWAVLYEL